MTGARPRLPALLAWVAVGALAQGCASSVLVAAGDPAFARAQQRLARTMEAVERSGASVEERSLFVQAEAFYRYRFQPPRRLLLSYLAEAASAMVDLPALQAVAGSIDMAELRLRMYDGSVQLWETLLQRYPRTSLRPLALYRLGWAYRSAGASGLPRPSGQQAFAELLREAPATPLAALAGQASPLPWKSKSTATALTLIPGLGQFYVGERLNGALRVTMALASAALVVAPAVIAYRRRDDLRWGRDWPLLTAGVAGLILLSIDYTAAYRDALRGVVEFNERVEDDFAGRHPEAP
jgi:hypothetical protein